MSLKGRDVDELQMARKALGAMLATLDDPFTNYIPPSQFDSYRSRKQEQVVGIGLQLEPDTDGRFRVISALRDGPSDLPQVQTGYELARVDGNPIRGIDPARLAQILGGEQGSTVSIELLTPHGTDITVAVARRAVEVEYIHWHRLQDNIVKARVSWFSGTGYISFINKLREYVENGVKGLILDLRSNSGGSIISTRNIFSSLCREDVMYLGRKRNEDNIPDRILGEHQFDLPIVAVINEGTFSAGEVLAGALKDHGRATLVGQRTGGKGSMQQIFPLEGSLGGALRITTATNCTPSGQVVQDQGISPHLDVKQPNPVLFVDDGPQNISEQGRSYVKALRFQHLLRGANAQQVAALELEWKNGDMQLAAAVVALSGEISKEDV